MGKYRLILKPMAPFFFGEEQASKSEEAFYYMKSRKLPQQTSLLGMLRYEVLKQEPTFSVKKYSEYSHDERIQMQKLIGGHSFSMKKSESDYGYIKKLGTVNLMNDEGQVLVKAPLDNRSTTQYEAYSLSKDPVITSQGDIHYLENYDPKNVILNGWMNSSGKIECEDAIFRSVSRVGNRVVANRDENEDGFYKQEYLDLCDGYKFCIDVDLDGILLQDSIVEMGKERSSFFMKVIPIDKQDKINKIENPSKICCESDVYVTQEQWSKLCQASKFRIVEEIGFRNRRTEIGSVQREKVRYFFIQRGSVFYLRDSGTKNDLVAMIKGNTNLTTIGYNNIY